jgi:hypothetical protein
MELSQMKLACVPGAMWNGIVYNKYKYSEQRK